MTHQQVTREGRTFVIHTKVIGHQILIEAEDSEGRYASVFEATDVALPLLAVSLGNAGEVHLTIDEARVIHAALAGYLYGEGR